MPRPAAALSRAAAWREFDALNERFYRQRAESFSCTRQRTWPGWTRVLEICANGRKEPGPGPYTVLDLGCGNGRFSDLLTQLPVPWTYTGVERSMPLLRATSARLAGRRHGASLLQANLLAWPFSPIAAAERARGFDLVVAFGFFHHVPGHLHRQQLANRLGQLTRPGGHCALSFWQFANVASIAKRALPPQELVSRGQLSAPSLAQLEPGDYFLPWGDAEPGASSAVRYCHSTSDEEVQSLSQHAFPHAQFETPVAFRCDGRTAALNHYVVAQRRA